MLDRVAYPSARMQIMFINGIPLLEPSSSPFYHGQPFKSLFRKALLRVLVHVVQNPRDSSSQLDTTHTLPPFYICKIHTEHRNAFQFRVVKSFMFFLSSFFIDPLNISIFVDFQPSIWYYFVSIRFERVLATYIIHYIPFTKGRYILHTTNKM